MPFLLYKAAEIFVIKVNDLLPLLWNKIFQRISLETWLHACIKFILVIKEEKKKEKKPGSI